MSYTNVRVHDSLMQQIEAKKTGWQSTTAIVNDLLSFAIDTSYSLGKPSPPAPGAPVLPSSLNGFIKEEERARALPEALMEEEINHPLIEAKAFAQSIKQQGSKYTPGFEAFWKVYQSCPDRLRARSQSKPKAFDAYRAALQKVDPADLQRAVQVAVQGQLDAHQADVWVPSLPDAFRWLKDGNYEVLLEDHQPAQAEYPSDVLR